MESKIVICGTCGHSQEIKGDKIVGHVYFPDRTVYCDDKKVCCPNHSRTTNMVIFGENVVTSLNMDYDVFYKNKTITDSNIAYYKKMIARGDKYTPKYQKDLESYKEIVHQFNK